MEDQKESLIHQVKGHPAATQGQKTLTILVLLVALVLGFWFARNTEVVELISDNVIMVNVLVVAVVLGLIAFPFLVLRLAMKKYEVTISVHKLGDRHFEIHAKSDQVDYKLSGDLEYEAWRKMPQGRNQRTETGQLSITGKEQAQLLLQGFGRVKEDWGLLRGNSDRPIGLLLNVPMNDLKLLKVALEQAGMIKRKVLD